MGTRAHMLVGSVALALLLGSGRPDRAPVDGDDEVAVVVAARSLYQGVPITSDDVYVLTMPRRYVLEGVALPTPLEVVGRIPHERILANEPIREERLASIGEGGTPRGINAAIPRGMRAYTVEFDAGGEPLTAGGYVEVDAIDARGRPAHPPLDTTFVMGTWPAADGRQAATLLLSPAEAVTLARLERDQDVTLILTPSARDREGRPILVSRAHQDPSWAVTVEVAAGAVAEGVVAGNVVDVLVQEHDGTVSVHGRVHSVTPGGAVTVDVDGPHGQRVARAVAEGRVRLVPVRVLQP